MSRPPIRREPCSVCGHSRVQHENDPDGCWGHSCIWDGPRCQEFVAGPVREPVDRNVTRIRHDATDTSRAAGVKTLPRSGTLRSHVYRHILLKGGATCDEIEWAITKSHQSVSAAVNTLMNDELIGDSGERRPTRWGQDAIVWKVLQGGGPDD